MNILAVGAHFDDIEIGCGGTLKKLKDQGNNLFYYVGTISGFQSLKDLHHVRDSEVAREEGIKAANKMGATLFQGKAYTFDLNYGADLDTEIARIIESNKIDFLFNQWSDDYHHDHWSISKAAYHGAKHVKRVLEYDSSWYEAQTQFTPNFFYNISDNMGFKKELLKEFTSEYERVGEKWNEYVTSLAKLYGLKCSCEYAEGFKCIRWME